MPFFSISFAADVLQTRQPLVQKVTEGTRLSWDHLSLLKEWLDPIGENLLAGTVVIGQGQWQTEKRQFFSFTSFKINLD